MTPKPFIVFILTFVISCTNNTKHNDNKHFQFDSSKSEKNIASKKPYRIDTILRDSNFIVLGDTSNHVAKSIDYVAIKFKPYIKFSDFQVDTFKDKKRAVIQYSSNPTARQFRTLITTTYKDEGLNFAGHYCFVEWGCGTDCQSSALVDLNTGIVYDGVDAALGYDFEKDSRMLIVNPTDSTGFYLNCFYCEPQMFIWNDKDKKFEQR